ncbi:MAG: flippase-like domain-containing protein [Myxococcales bacterium]|nr:flippase-like domain-containing protein [Myxococcales bacterium]
MKRALRGTVTAGLLVGVGFLVLRRDGAEDLLARLLAADGAWMLAAFGLHFVAVLLGTFRWSALLRSVDVRLPLDWLLRTYFAGRFVGAYTPSTVGLDVFRMVRVARRTGDRSRPASILLSEKLIGFVGLALLSALLLPMGVVDAFGSKVAYLTLGLFVISSIGLVALGQVRRFRGTFDRFGGRLGSGLRSLVRGLHAPRLGRQGWAGNILLAFLSHLATSLVFVATARALSIDVDASTLVAVGNAIVLATLLPVSIGGIGVREGVAVVLLGLAGVSPADATLVAFAGYLLGQGPALVGGAVLLAEMVPASDLQPEKLGDPLVANAPFS